jgi:hypothetical protein
MSSKRNYGSISDREYQSPNEAVLDIESFCHQFSLMTRFSKNGWACMHGDGTIHFRTSISQ